MTSEKFSLWLLSLGLFAFSGCALLTNHTRMEVFKEDGKSFSIYNLSKDTTIEKVGETPRAVEFRMHNKSLYLLKQTQEGKFPTRELVPRRREGGYGFLGLLSITGTTVMATVGVITAGNEATNSPLLITAGGLGTVLLITDALSVPDGLYPRKYSLATMYDKPQHQPGQRSLYTGSLNTTEQTKVHIYSYETTKGFDEKHPSALGTIKWGQEQLQYYKPLRDFLAQTGYVDTTRKLFAGAWNTYSLDASIKTITIHMLELSPELDEYKPKNFIRIEGGIEWELTDYLTHSQMHENTFTATSPLFMIQDLDDDRLFEAFHEMLKRSLSQFLLHKNTQPHLESDSLRYMKRFRKWDTLTVDTQARVTSLNTVSQSGVTVQSGDKHGSGFLVSEQGYIITNYHVIASREEVTVAFDNEMTYNARILRSNPRYDLSLLKIDLADTATLQPIRFAANPTSSVGDRVYAVGTPIDRDLHQTLSQGVLSGKREVEQVTYLQHDTKLNRGNSGGPLLNEQGQLLGVVNVKLTGTSLEDVGFALPTSIIPQALKLRFR